MKALISIDYTNNFGADNGTLTTGLAGEKIETEMLNVTESFIKNNNFVVFVIDTHDPSNKFYPENSLFPPHNIIGTLRQQLFGSLNNLYRKYKNSNHIYRINKRYYSAFCGSDIDLQLHKRCSGQLCYNWSSMGFKSF